MRIKVECMNITKRYDLFKRGRDKYKALLIPGYKPEQYTALDNVNLTCHEGEIVGILGLNGAGKSTLTSIIAGIIHPDSGELRIDGKAQKLAAGVGLDSFLTGRENITYKCMLLGLNKKEIAEIEPLIIDFAELGKFIDRPLRTYSSGMKARLGFGISVHLDPDILIMDEALSAGDGSFKQKSADKIYEFKEKGKTIIIVGHGNEKDFCDRLMWLHRGKVVGIGPTEEVGEAFKQFTRMFSKMSAEEKEVYVPEFVSEG